MWPNDHILVFIHIPKTAGSSVGRIIYENAYNRSVKHLSNPDDLYYMTDIELNSADALIGHFGFGILRRISRPQIRMTILRDPVERIVSLYHYHRMMAKDDEPYGSDRYIAKNFPFDFFIEKAKEWSPLHCATHNTQTWQLFEGRYLPTRQKYTRKPVKEILDTAKQNLNSLHYVGFQDNLPQFFDDLCKNLDFKIKKIPREKENPQRQDVSKLPVATLRNIENMVELDLELYHYAKQQLS